MSSGRDVRIGEDVQRTPQPHFPFTFSLGQQPQPGASLVGGFLACARRPFNPLLAALPHRIHMRGMSSGWLSSFTRQVTEESRLGRAGAASVLTRLAELMFIEVLRRYLEDLPPEQNGWLAGLRDEVVGRVLTLLHGRPSHPWILAELAQEAAASRTNLAKRFAQLVGQPPMQYLTQWRMQGAANLLIPSGTKGAEMRAEGGYGSRDALNRAF